MSGALYSFLLERKGACETYGILVERETAAISLTSTRASHDTASSLNSSGFQILRLAVQLFPETCELVELVDRFLHYKQSEGAWMIRKIGKSRALCRLVTNRAPHFAGDAKWMVWKPDEEVYAEDRWVIPGLGAVVIHPSGHHNK